MTRRVLNQEVSQTSYHHLVSSWGGMTCVKVTPGHPLSCCQREARGCWRCGLPDRPWLGLQAPFPTAQSLQSPLSLPQAMGGALPSHTGTSQSNFTCSLRFSSPGKPLHGSRIQIRDTWVAPISAPKPQPPWAWLLTIRGYSLRAGKTSSSGQIPKTVDKS